MSDSEASVQTEKPQGAWEPDPIQSKSGGGERMKYFRLADGESADIRLLVSEPLRLWMHRILVGKIGYPATCLGTDGSVCPAHGKGLTASRTIVTLVLDRRDGLVKLYEFSNRMLGDIFSTAQTVMRFRPELKSPNMYDLTISRTGKTKSDTRYKVSAGTNMGAISEAELAKFNLPSLAEYYKPNKERMEKLLAGVVPTRPATAETRQAATQQEEESSGVSGVTCGESELF